MPRTDPPRSRLVENLMQFVRALRAAGLGLGTGKVLDTVRAVQAVGITSRHDFYWTLHAVLVSRHRDRALFDQVFHVFWRNPHFLERMLSLAGSELREGPVAAHETISRRAQEALAEEVPPPADGHAAPELEVDARLTSSDQELLQHKDFEQMSVEEVAQAKAAIARMRLPLAQVATRRFRPDSRGSRVDMRRTLSRGLRRGPDAMLLQRCRRRTQPPPLVVLCDISGSMSRYSKMVLHFMHCLTGDRERVHSFVFGTRLSNISRYLRDTDVDLALSRVAGAVQDWGGGTRIGECLAQFNRLWSRRVLAQGAVVLLISDGLDRDVGEGLDAQAQRLHMSCRRLIWLNPLLRYERFEAKAGGMRALLPHVDELRSVHNLESLGELCAVLSRAQERSLSRAA